MDVTEVRKLDAYLKRLFGNPKIRVVPRPKKDDSAEVYIGEEFIGVLFVDDACQPNQVVVGPSGILPELFQRLNHGVEWDAGVARDLARAPWCGWAGQVGEEGLGLLLAADLVQPQRPEEREVRVDVEHADHRVQVSHRPAG